MPPFPSPSSVASASRRLAAVLLCGASSVHAGCVSFGSSELVSDRANFNAAIGTSWNEQLLGNLLRLRHGEAPVILDIVSVRTQYELSESAGFDPLQISFDGDGRIGLFGGVARRSEPRVTYRPLEGREFAATMLAPIPPESIMLLTESGRDAGWILRACVERINGLRNDGRPEGAFNRLAEDLIELQRDGLLVFRVRDGRDGRDGREATLTFAETDERTEDLRHRLGLEPDRRTFVVESSPIRQESDVIAIQTRSLMTVMQQLADAARVTTPLPAVRADPIRNEEHGSDGTVDPDAAVPRLRILRTAAAPEHALVSVRHRGAWHWIDRDDAASTRAISLLTQLFAIQDGDSDDIVPVLRVNG